MRWEAWPPSGLWNACIVTPLARGALTCFRRARFLAVTAGIAESEGVDVCGIAFFEDEDELMPGAIEGPHPAIGLDPNADILELELGQLARPYRLFDMAPIDENEANAAIDKGLGHAAKGVLQEVDVDLLGHLAGGHGEVAMLDLPESGGMAEDRHVVRGIGEGETRLLPTEKSIIAPWIPRIAAQEQMLT